MLHPLENDPRRHQTFSTWLQRLQAAGVRLGERFTLFELHKAVYPRWPVKAWVEFHNEELLAITRMMERDGLLRVAIGPRGGAGWTLVKTPSGVPGSPAEVRR